MTTSIDKDRAQLLKRLRAQGFTVSVTGNGHYAVSSETGAIVIAARTSNSARGLLNFKSQLRKTFGIKC